MLIAKNIHKKYKETVLNGVDFKAAPGEIVGIAGANGSGKSTLLAILIQLIKPDIGNVTIDGEQPDPKALGYCPQETILHENLSVKDNLRFWAAAYGLDYKQFLTDSARYPFFSDKKTLNKQVKKLSGGTKKWLSVNLSDLHKPKYTIMDEPSAALDIAFKAQLREKFTLAKKDNRTVVFSTHHPDEMLWCDRLYVLRDEVFVYEGVPQGLAEGDFADALYTVASSGA